MPLDEVVDDIVDKHGNEFCWSLYFDPPFLARLFYSGFLPICTDLGDSSGSLYCLLPKLHYERAVLVMSDGMHISKKVKKKAAKYALSINQAFDEVIEGVWEEHGENCWLHAPLVEGLRDLVRECILTGPVEVFSVELWSVETDRLVAGEIGYRVGAIYTSMTGFFCESGTGSIQLASLGRWLVGRGFKVWDFGMMMDYKRDIGCQSIQREQFVQLVREYREIDLSRESMSGYSRINAKELIS
jgi:Leu/Phe-tRNA-protein transferase